MALPEDCDYSNACKHFNFRYILSGSHICFLSLMLLVSFMASFWFGLDLRRKKTTQKRNQHNFLLTAFLSQVLIIHSRICHCFLPYPVQEKMRQGFIISTKNNQNPTVKAHFVFLWAEKSNSTIIIGFFILKSHSIKKKIQTTDQKTIQHIPHPSSTEEPDIKVALLLSQLMALLAMCMPLLNFSKILCWL